MKLKSTIKVIYIAFIMSIMVGCTDQSQDRKENNISQQEKVNISANENISENKENKVEEVITKEEKSNEEKSNKDISLNNELINKKQQYLQRLKNISIKFENESKKYDNGEYSSADLRDAIIESYEGYDKILNEIYQDLKRYIPEDRMKAIKVEQLKWIDYKEEQHKYFLEIGTGAIADQQMAAITEIRCKELLEYLIDEKIENVENNKSETHKYTVEQAKKQAISVLETNGYYDSNDLRYELTRHDDKYNDNKIYYMFGVIYNDEAEDYCIEHDYCILIEKNTLEAMIYTGGELMSVDKYFNY